MSPLAARRSSSRVMPAVSTPTSSSSSLGLVERRAASVSSEACWEVEAERSELRVDRGPQLPPDLVEQRAAAEHESERGRPYRTD